MERTNVYQHDDIVYVNALIYNDTPRLARANLFKTISDAIVDNPQQYYLAITRFAISHMDIPIYFFENNKYSVTINGSQVFLVYENEGNYANYSGQQPVFSYKNIERMINTALSAAFTAAAVAGGSAPFMIYENDKFNLYVHPDNVDGGAHSIEIFMNAPLFQQFQFFRTLFNGYNSNLGRDYRILITPGPANYNLVTVGGANYYIFEQERIALYLFNDIESIIFTTATLPIVSEYLTIQGGTNQPITIPILSNFVPDLSVGRNLSEYQYYANGNYKLINMNGSQKLNTIDFQLSVRTKAGQIFQLFLEPGETVSVNFAFILKSLNNNQFTHLYNFEQDESFSMPIIANMLASQSAPTVERQVLASSNTNARERHRMEDSVKNTINRRFIRQ